MKKFWSKSFKYLSIPLGLLLSVSSIWLFQTGFTWVSEIRQLDRLPLSHISIVKNGPYALTGIIEQNSTLLLTPYSNSAAVYYRYKLEEEYTNSDGKKSTRTIDSGERISAFSIMQDKHEVLLNPTLGGDINWSVKETYSQKRGRRTYTEWALKPGTQVEVLGRKDPQRNDLVFYDLNYNLPSIITDKTIKHEGSYTMLYAGLIISLAAGFASMGAALILTGIKIHRYMVFVSLLTTLLISIFWIQGFQLLKYDWQQALSLYQQRAEGYTSDQNPETAKDLYQMYLRISRSANGFPDQQLFKGLDSQFQLPKILTQDQKHQLEQQLSNEQVIRFENIWVSSGLIIVGALLSILSVWKGIKIIVFKRKIEAIPTSKTKGLTYGTAELYGMIDVDDHLPAISSHLKHKKCVAYDYLIEERRGTGKNKRWVNIEEGGEWSSFWLLDDQGRVSVNSSDANIRYPESETWRDGKLRYTEKWLPPFRNIYCLGYAAIDPLHPDRLSIQASEKELTLISTQEEADIVQGEGSKGFTLTSLGLSFCLVAGMSLLASTGQFTPADLFKTSLFVPLFLIITTTVLHYNDLVFLRNRVFKVSSDIDTLLLRRYELWPNLLQVVKRYLSHEKKLLQAITKLRKIPPAPSNDTDKMENRLQFEEKVVKAVIARAEAHPDLKGDKVLSLFKQQMTDSENQLALVRSGLLDSKEIYHTRIQSFPDLIIAKLFGFKESN